jgi:hypothetical protein
MTIGLLWEFVKALPEIISLLQVIDKNIKVAETDRKVSDDIKSIHKAFSEKDPTKLDHLFDTK